MKTQPYVQLSPENAAKLIANSLPNEIEKNISKLTFEQIGAAIQELNEHTASDWQEKIQAAIAGLNQRPQLESAGKHLTLPQLIALIDSVLKVDNKHHWKLSPLLVGMPHANFLEFMMHARDEQLQIFKDEGVTEPVQHHLTTLSHDMTWKIMDEGQKIAAFEKSLEILDTSLLNHSDIDQLHRTIDKHTAFFQQLYAISVKALSIAWNTPRIDLIESLNKVKDGCQKYIIYLTGEPQKTAGLHEKITQRLFEIYGNPADTKNPESLQDSEPAFEALVKFSIWYLRDYWELGLLPQVKNIKELDLENHPEQEHAKQREKLFAEARNHLEKIGLATVADLKKNLIFSRKTLQEYIQSR